MSTSNNIMKNAIIIGASSGIGEALAMELSAEDYRLGLTARRYERLQTLQNTLPNEAIIQQMDISDIDILETKFAALLQVLGPIDLMIIAAGTGHHNAALDPTLERETITTNITGFTVLAGAAFKHFHAKNNGHLVGISSIAALRGNPSAPAYNASKVYMSNYLEGLRLKALKENLNITVTDLRPGYVDTKMAEGDHLFWVAPVQKSAAQIMTAIKAKKSVAYITKRWLLIAWLMRIMPDFLYKKL